MHLPARIFCRLFQTAFRIALPILPYREPQLLDSMQAIPPLLQQKQIASVLLVTDAGVRSLGLLRPLEESLAKAGIACAVYDKTVPNPTIENVEEARSLYLSSDAKAIIAVGGGSVMDCAKVVGARIARPRKSVSSMGGLLRILRSTPLTIAVPTTAGTGSEATLAAVITDAKARHKYPINDFCLIPDFAVLDPELTIGLPPHLTATTGMDALTHAVEAYIGRSTTAFTRSMAVEATRLILTHLPVAVADGRNTEARRAMLRAAYCAGAAFTRSYVGYVHGVAHSLGGRYGIAHGLANAVILPHFLKAYGSACHARLARLARESGAVEFGLDDAQTARRFIERIEQMNASFSIPTVIPQIQREDIPAMARHAAQESNPLYPVPRLMDRRELEDLYLQLMPPEKNVPIPDLVARQKAYFASGATLSLTARREALSRLYRAILRYEGEILDALHRDLNKSSTEAYMCEIGTTLSELRYMQRHLSGFARRRHVRTPLAHFAADSYTVRDPYGVALIMSPWNYPFMLTMEPLIGAIAAGNCCIIKPSAYAPATSHIIARIIASCFSSEYLAVVEGGRAENQSLLDQPFDTIFFTGGTSVGREVMRRASEHLTPVTLELGGKSPVIIDKTANLDLAAKRIAFGKLLNCGQTCVAPDYVLIDRSIKEVFIRKLITHMDQMVGMNALKNQNYVRMVNRKHYDRVLSLIDPQKVVCGGTGSEETLQILPTILDHVTGEDAVMQEEIFGPVLPVIAYDDINEALAFVNSRPHPLALYLFTENDALKRMVLRCVPFGGGCINDTIIHLATSRMGFGGVGASGMGSYHGKKSFDAFSHEKSIVDKATWLDLPIRYAPYTSLKDRMLRFFLR